MNKRTEIVVASAILVLVLHTLALSVLASSSGKERGLKGRGKRRGRRTLLEFMRTTNVTLRWFLLIGE
jgi:hypothetical protein